MIRFLLRGVITRHELCTCLIHDWLLSFIFTQKTPYTYVNMRANVKNVNENVCFWGVYTARPWDTNVRLTNTQSYEPTSIKPGMLKFLVTLVRHNERADFVTHIKTLHTFSSSSAQGRRTTQRCIVLTFLIIIITELQYMYIIMFKIF